MPRESFAQRWHWRSRINETAQAASGRQRTRFFRAHSRILAFTGSLMGTNVSNTRIIPTAQMKPTSPKSSRSTVDFFDLMAASHVALALAQRVEVIMPSAINFRIVTAQDDLMLVLAENAHSTCKGWTLASSKLAPWRRTHSRWKVWSTYLAQCRPQLRLLFVGK